MELGKILGLFVNPQQQFWEQQQLSEWQRA